MINKPGLYIHIPFCNEICAYCNFSKLFYLSKIADRYIDALEYELSRYNDYVFDSIYIGGGTPTSLNIVQLERLLKIINKYKNECTIITIETNPDIDQKKINLLKQYHINRISIGIQTFNIDYLKLMKRYVYNRDITTLINNIHHAGIEDINVDLIYGLPNQSIDMLKDDLEKMTSLDITHISAYCLQIEEGTLLYSQGYREMDEDKARDQYDFIVKYLKDKNIYRYEVSNFAKIGFESKHNLIYWKNKEYLGVGLGASTYIDNIRRTNTKSISNYINLDFDDYNEILTLEDKKFYFVMLGLRLTSGLDIDEYKLEYGASIFDDYQKIKKLIDIGCLILEGSYLKISPDYIYVMDTILQQILFD